MPLYDYLCAACGARFEVVHGVHGDSPTACPVCGNGPVRKAITAAAIHYRGTGWAKKERRATVATGTSSETRDGGSTPSAEGGASGTSDGGSSATSDAKAPAPESKATTKPAEPSPSRASD